MNISESRIAVIKNKIDRIKQSTQKKKSKFYLNSPITSQEIIEIENEYGIIFPSEYRAFITNIGNGGWSLLSLERSLQWLYVEVLKDKLDYDFLRIPFVHTSIYNPDEDPYILELGEKCNLGEITELEWDKVYSYLTAGTIAISLDGCGYYFFLVITGSTRGQIWFNANVADGGFIPLDVGFLDWYEKKLNNFLI